ncbi:MAG: hypothetical protein BWZ08_01292 [candidate division BRC1 bacterium ADurb.BinA292]|nr:MAG: hypothetical protein BWZ08_01292 [candidate division BRC1 bacterium ADurb.BinA292]
MRTFSRQPQGRFARGRGFTLLEILIASVIFGLTSVAIITVLRTGVNAWRTGHRLSEVMQTARIAQDVVLRDLNNLMYLPEDQYNNVFKQQLQQLAQEVALDPDYDYLRGDRERRRERERRRREREREREENRGEDRREQDPLSLDRIAPPIDLTFEGQDGGDKDRLTFTRAYQPRWPGDPQTWGIRRVSFYVEDGTLYRKEEDAFSYSPGSIVNRRDLLANPRVQSLYDSLRGNTRIDLDAFFGMSTTESSYDQLASMYYDPELEVLVPRMVEIAEPLCEGVEVFNITYGYFRDEQWVEVGDWNSGATRYRDPPDLDFDFAQLEEQLEQVSRLGGIMLSPEQLFGRRSPDNLPGYVAVQLGVRAAEGVGRLYSFTFFHSLPQAQETDVYRDEMEFGDRPPPLREARRSRLDERYGDYYR